MLAIVCQCLISSVSINSYSHPLFANELVALCSGNRHHLKDHQYLKDLDSNSFSYGGAEWARCDMTTPKGQSDGWDAGHSSVGQAVFQVPSMY